jgi:hypothetical protein
VVLAVTANENATKAVETRGAGNLELEEKLAKDAIAGLHRSIALPATNHHTANPANGEMGGEIRKMSASRDLRCDLPLTQVA